MVKRARGGGRPTRAALAGAGVLVAASVEAMIPAVAWAASTNASARSVVAGGELSPTWLLVVVCASLLPFLLLMMTCFVKVAVVLSILRSAIGGSQIPPASIITGLAMVLTVYVMAPTGERMYQALQSGGASVSTSPPASDVLRGTGFAAVMDVADRVKEPLRDFLLKNADARERATFGALAIQMRAPAAKATDVLVSDRDFVVLAPAFVTSELRRAFEIGFLLFLPFLILDLVITNLLTALGIQSLNPTSVSLPFKLLLFVLIDGWHLVARGLIQSYL
jgi:type III secretion protein R